MQWWKPFRAVNSLICLHCDPFSKSYILIGQSLSNVISECDARITLFGLVRPQLKGCCPKSLPDWPWKWLKAYFCPRLPVTQLSAPFVFTTKSSSHGFVTAVSLWGLQVLMSCPAFVSSSAVSQQILPTSGRWNASNTCTGPLSHSSHLHSCTSPCTHYFFFFFFLHIGPSWCFSENLFTTLAHNPNTGNTQVTHTETLKYITVFVIFKDAATKFRMECLGGKKEFEAVQLLESHCLFLATGTSSDGRRIRIYSVLPR